MKVLNNGMGHWLVASTLGTDHPTVSLCIFDSMLPAASSHVKKQIAGLLHTSYPSILLKYMGVHLQAGGNDCGLFAFITALALRYSPGQFQFDQQQMHPHLIKCLEQRKMEMFPIKRYRRPKQYRTKSREYVPVYCICRLPETLNMKWVECSSCKQWYHPTCVEIPKQAIKNKSVPWHCQSLMLLTSWPIDYLAFCNEKCIVYVNIIGLLIIISY